MFQDPSKSQGFLGDVGSLFSGNNRAAVYADEYNPFPKAGFGEDWYKDKFKFASGLGSLMEGAENFIPGATWAKQFLPKSKRLPLERDLSWVPEGLGEYDELPMMEFEDEAEDAPLQDLFLPWNDLWKDGEDDLLGEDFTEPLDDITEKIVEEGVKDVDEPVVDEFKIFENPEIFNNVFAFPEQTGFTNFASAFDSPWNVFESAKEKMSKKTNQEILDLLIKRGFLIDTTLEEE